MISSFRGASAVRTFNPSFAGAFAREFYNYIYKILTWRFCDAAQIRQIKT